MIDSQLSHLLTRLPSDDGRPSRHCPDEHRLAAYAERRLPGAERSLLESHLADCGSCLGQVAFLARAPRPETAPAVPARWVDAATGVRGRRFPRLLPAASALAAASGAVAVILWLAVPGGGSLRLDRGSGATRSAPVERAHGVDPRVAAPSLLAPREGEALARAGLELRWSAVPGALFYTVQMMNLEGDLLWEGRTDGTRLAVPADLALASGGRYFAWVEVHLAGGASGRSPATLFELKPP